MFWNFVLVWLGIAAVAACVIIQWDRDKVGQIVAEAHEDGMPSPVPEIIIYLMATAACLVIWPLVAVALLMGGRPRE